MTTGSARRDDAALSPSPASGPVVRGNDYGGLTPEPLDTWTATRSVSVVVPAYECQETLDLTLASLAAQTHSPTLLEVVVVDDGSRPPLVLPELRPEHTRLVRSPDGGWGPGHARHVGALAADGEVLHWLDSDMVVFAEHVAAQARWHDLTDHLVTLGYKRFVEPVPMTPRHVYDAVAGGRADTLYDLEASTRHEWIEKIMDDTEGLRLAGPEAFRVHVGATATVRRDLYLACGGMDPSMKLAEDSELGYRLGQAGAVFVPEPAARSWHLGLSTIMRTVGVVARHNRPYITDRMPVPRFRRRVEPGRLWTVPFVDVQVVAGQADYETVKATVDSALQSSAPDLTVSVVGEWSRLDDARRSPLRDPDLDRRLVVANYAGDPRVRLVDEPSPTAFPAPFRLHLPVGWVMGAGTLEHLVKDAEERRLALSLAALPGVDPASAVLRLERTASVSRALRLLAARGTASPDPDELDDLLDRVGGQRWYDAADVGVSAHVAGDVEPVPVPAVPTTAAEWRKEALAARAEARRWKADAKRWKDEARSESRRAKQLAQQVQVRSSLPRRGVRALVRRARRLTGAAVPRRAGT